MTTALRFGWCLLPYRSPNRPECRTAATKITVARGYGRLTARKDGRYISYHRPDAEIRNTLPGAPSRERVG